MTSTTTDIADGADELEGFLASPGPVLTVDRTNVQSNSQEFIITFVGRRPLVGPDTGKGVSESAFVPIGSFQLTPQRFIETAKMVCRTAIQWAHLSGADVHEIAQSLHEEIDLSLKSEPKADEEVEVVNKEEGVESG